MSRSAPPENLCILRLSAIGDVCHTVAALRLLQDNFDQTRITWVIGKVEATLVGDIPGVDFVVFDKGGGLPAWWRLRQRLASTRFDILLNMQASVRGNWISGAIRAERRIGFDPARARDRQGWFCNESIPPAHNAHVIEGLLSFAHHIGATPTSPRWDIPLSADHLAYATDVLQSKPTLVISPCSSERARNFRNWSRDNYRDIAKYAISEHGLQIVVCGAGTPTEHDYARAIGQDLPGRFIDLVGKTSLKQLLAVIAQARAVICPDSGPAHMATTVGTPVIGLYATSNPERTGPYLSQEFTVNRYPDAVVRYLNSTVDQVRWGQRVRDPDAMSIISLDDVTKKLDRVMTA